MKKGTGFTLSGVSIFVFGIGCFMYKMGDSFQVFAMRDQGAKFMQYGGLGLL